MSKEAVMQVSMRSCAGVADLAARSAVTVTVLAWLCRQGAPGGLRVSQGEIARRIGASRQSVVRALGTLEAEGWVASTPTAGGRKTYFVDPEFCRRESEPNFFYEAREAAGAHGVPAWRAGKDPWRLTRPARRTIVYVPDSPDSRCDVVKEKEVKGDV